MSYPTYNPAYNFAYPYVQSALEAKFPSHLVTFVRKGLEPPLFAYTMSRYQMVSGLDALHEFAAGNASKIVEQAVHPSVIWQWIYETMTRKLSPSYGYLFFR